MILKQCNRPSTLHFLNFETRKYVFINCLFLLLTNQILLCCKLCKSGINFTSMRTWGAQPYFDRFRLFLGSAATSINSVNALESRNERTRTKKSKRRKWIADSCSKFCVGTGGSWIYGNIVPLLLWRKWYGQFT